MPLAATRRPSFALLLGLAWLATAGWLLYEFWASTAGTLFDTDDAMRLVEVRGFLAGHGWFDLAEPRLAPPAGYETHWSRLIDAGLAGLLVLFSQFVDAALAERLMRAVWPLLWLLPTMAAAAAIAWRLAGREAPLVVLAFVLFGLPAFQQFKPGRIDHHNVQIALAMLCVAATVWSDRLRWAATSAGAFTALALATGLESLPYVAACGAALALRFLFDGGAGPVLVRYGAALAAGTLAVFALTVSPDHWGRAACDAIAVNWAVPVVFAGLGLAAAAYLFADAGLPRRGAAVATVAAVAALAFVAIEPRCLAGPFAMLEPAAKALWLAQVREMEPLLSFVRTAPVLGAWIVAFPFAALLALAVLMRAPDCQRDVAFLLVGSVFALAVVTTLAAVKAYSYAMWFGMPLVAALVARSCETPLLRTGVARMAAALLLTPTVLSATAITIAQATTRVPVERSDRQVCFANASYAAMASLPPGLVAANVDYGPFVLALTPHAAIAAPYHRLSEAIVTAHEIFARLPGEARRILTERRVTYLATCRDPRPRGLDETAAAASLWGRLQAGDVPDWLEPVRPVDGPIVMYRVRP